MEALRQPTKGKQGAKKSQESEQSFSPEPVEESFNLIQVFSKFRIGAELDTLVPLVFAAKNKQTNKQTSE